MSVKRGGAKRPKRTIKQERVAVILPDRAFRHGKPLERRKNKAGEYIPTIIAAGPTMNKGKKNTPPESKKKVVK